MVENGIRVLIIYFIALLLVVIAIVFDISSEVGVCYVFYRFFIPASYDNFISATCSGKGGDKNKGEGS